MLKIEALPINIYFSLFEAMSFVLFAAMAWQASKQGRFRLLELLWAALYGFLLEWITIQQLHAYAYGPFRIMVDGAPLAIAFDWALIIYASMAFSDRIDLPDSARPILDALMALNVDLALDVIAVRLGMWRWNGVTLDQQWFGVPWANFFGWFVVVWSYSGFLRALRTWQRHRARQWFYPPLALLLSMAVLTTASEMYRVLSAQVGSSALAPLALVVGSLAILAEARPRLRHRERLEPMGLAVPALFHAFALVAGIGAGIFARQPILGVIGVIMLVAGLGAHLLPWLADRQSLTEPAV